MLPDETGFCPEGKYPLISFAALEQVRAAVPGMFPGMLATRATVGGVGGWPAAPSQGARVPHPWLHVQKT